jgi:hypothetical protein
MAPAANGVQVELLAFPASCGTAGASCSPLWSAALGSLSKVTGLYPQAAAIADGTLFASVFQSDSEAQDRFNFDAELDAFTLAP